MAANEATRPLTEDERRLARWMLEHAGAEACHYLGQLDIAVASTWRCPCGCASFNFSVPGKAEPPPGVHVLGDYVFGDDNDLSGIFIYSSDGTLSGVEVYGLAGDAPTSLPRASELRPAAFPEGAQDDT